MRRFTVIIPTRDRADTLRFALQTVCAQDFDSLQIIVSDNASEDSTREMVTSFSDPRITYLNTNRRLGMSQNWEFALSHADGDWVGIVGDDDGLLPNALERTSALMDEYPVDAIRSTSCPYSWPGLLGRSNGELIVPLGRRLQIRNSAEVLAEVRAGKLPYTSLPMLYNGGFVKRAVLEGGKRNGRYYHSRIPDVYSAVQIAASVPTFLDAGPALAINGASSHSTGTSFFKPSKRRPADPAARFAIEPNLPYHPLSVPQVQGELPPSIELLIFESILHVREAYPEMPLGDIDDWYSLICNKRKPDVDLTGWRQAFTKVHGLPYEPKHSPDGLARRTLFRLAGLTKNFAFVRVGPGDSIPLENVSQAAEVAGRILADPPSPLGCVAKNVFLRVARGTA